MTTEAVLLLAIYAFVLLGVFLGESGPIAVFEQSTPRLAARIERDLSVGKDFRTKDSGQSAVGWIEP